MDGEKCDWMLRPAKYDLFPEKGGKQNLGVRLNSNIEKRKNQYTARNLFKKFFAVLCYPSSVLYRTENLNVFAWESDSLA